MTATLGLLDAGVSPDGPAGDYASQFGDDATVWTGRCRYVDAEDDGDYLTVDAPAGATVLHLDSAEDFYPGATIRILNGYQPTDPAAAPSRPGAQPLPGTGTEDMGDLLEAEDDGGGLIVTITAGAPADDNGDSDDVNYTLDTIRIDTPLPELVPADTVVQVWDPERLAPATVYYAVVDVDEWDDPEPAYAVADPTQVPYLRQGTTDGDGPVVTIARDPGKGQTDYVVTSIPGQRPRFDGSWSDELLLAAAIAGSAEKRATAKKPGRILAGTPGGARVDVNFDDEGGYLRFVDSTNTTKAILRVLIDDDGRVRFNIAAGNGPDAARVRIWDLTDGDGKIDLLAQEILASGLLRLNRGLKLPLTNSILRGGDGNDNVERVTSNTGVMQIQHDVGGTVSIAPPLVRLGSSQSVHPRDVVVTFNGTQNGGIVEFKVCWAVNNGENEPANTPVVNRLVTFDWSVRKYER